MAVDSNHLDEVLNKARELALSDDHPLDSLTVKDLKLAADPDSDAIMTNDQKASIISVVIIAT